MASGSLPKYQYLKPSAIRFTQDSISPKFSKTNRTLSETLGKLLEEGMPKRDVPMIRVVHRYGQWWSLDNRRLWIFRELEKKGGCGVIKVQVVPIDENEWKKKFTTKNNGASVRIRGEELAYGGGVFSGGGVSYVGATYIDSDEDLV